MEGKRNSGLFPSSSIGRAGGSQIPRISSHDSLAAHPLLSSTSTSNPPGSSALLISSVQSTTVDNQLPLSPTTPTPTTRYVPYTPRQRGAPTSATTGTTMHSSIQASPQAQSFHGDATTKLQLMNLKAAAQKGGLDAASTGWAILEKLGTEADHSTEWNDIWNALAISKATLLLPLDPHPSNEPITSEFLKDHIALCDGPTRKDAPIITLSGLRGVLDDETLTFRSTLDPSSKTFQALLNPTTRAKTLASLPPLPLFPTSTSVVTDISHTSPSASPISKSPGPSKVSYPTFNVSLHHASLPLPPRPTLSTSSPSKPPLPPRPGARPTSSATPATPQGSAAASRLSNPFASLFGRAATPTPPASPTVSTSPLHSVIGDGTQTVEGTSEHVLGVPAFTISTRIIRRDISKTIMRTLQTEIKIELGHAPSWVLERIEEFVGRCGLMPFVKPKSKSKLVENGSGNANLSGIGGGYIVAPEITGDEVMESIGRQFQEFYLDLEDELGRRKWRHGFGRSHSQQQQHHPNGSPVVPSSSESTSETEKVDGSDDKDEKKEGEESSEGEKEKRIREVMEHVEKTICSLFYDKLFLQPSSDDANHDEALSSRIAAVNLLDLTLSHLGVEVGNSGPAVEAVVKSCGDILSQLDKSYHAPAEKAAVLVAAHKIIVDGLSKLPPISLRSDDEMLDEKTPMASTFNKKGLDIDQDKDDKISNEPPTPTELTTIEITHPTEEDLTKHDAPSDSPNSVQAASSDDSGKEKGPSDSSNDAEATSPVVMVSPAPHTDPTPVSGDIILPLMIFAVVKSNPPHLVSHLLYIQRFRYEGIGGEENYCLINLLAVAEFLENVDLAALSLGDSEKTVLSAAELTPITVNRIGSEPNSPLSPLSVQASLRGRVEQQVDALAGSANKVFSGVVDSSFGVFRALLPGTPNPNAPTESNSGAGAGTSSDAQDTTTRPGFGLLRRDTGFSIASLAASLPGAVGRAKKDEESGQQLMEVPSRPGSSRSIRVEDATPSSSEASDDEEDDDDEEEEGYDTRSIRSFESMMSGKNNKRGKRAASGRKSITDRLASMPGLSGLARSATYHESSKTSPPASRRSSLLVPNVSIPTSNRYDSPASSRAASPVAIRISPPNPRFMECTEDNIKVSEVGELLREYKRLVEAVRAMGGFHDD
ncbi:hypothetical protein C8Q75DRAFT_745384 [Abortiporus biennis]|nr:hypothetical protein C8Q75DRAFT_745384 [Abortiporus biennis]